MSVTIISDNKIEFDGKMYKMLKPKKKYHCKLDPLKKQDRAVYMRGWRKQRKAEIDELYAMRAKLAAEAQAGTAAPIIGQLTEPSESK